MSQNSTKNKQHTNAGRVLIWKIHLYISHWIGLQFFTGSWRLWDRVRQFAKNLWRRRRSRHGFTGLRQTIFWSKKPVLNSIRISCLGLCWIHALAPMAIPKQDIFPRVWQVMRSWAAVNWNLQILTGYLKQSQWFLLLFGSFKKSLSQHCNDGNEFCLFELSAVEKWFHAYSKWWMLEGCKSNPFPESKCGWLQDFCNEARHSGFQ